MRFLWCVAVVLCAATSNADDQPWWKTAIFYQVYPRSFMDSDGDGTGDLKGITQMADYFTDIGVNAIWLSPIYKSPMADFGYDISNYTAIDPTYGTMDDFEALVTKLHEIDVKLVLDFVPNHSSDEHDWFQRSENNEADYRDFYVWRDPSGYDSSNNPLPPNNWISEFSGSAWAWSEKRKQFYYHQFLEAQPDLNYRNHDVFTEMTAVINFWLDKGIDGFRMDAVKYIFENSSYPNETIISGDGSIYNDLDHTYETDQPETFTLLLNWAEVVYQRVLDDSSPRAIFLEVYDTPNMTMEYYGTGNAALEFPFNFVLLSNGDESSRPADIKGYIAEWMDVMPSGGVANWVVGNHDNHRVADRYGYEMVDAINLLTGVLPGIKVTYNGEEIGMQDTFTRWDQTVDTQAILAGESGYQSITRDPERTPMQWDDSVSAGFSSNSTPWLPVNPNYYWLNVAAQKAADSSHLKVFQAMAKARHDPVLMYGSLDVQVPDNDTLLVIRSYNSSSFVLLVNMGSEVLSYTSTSLFSPYSIDINMTTVVASVNTGYTNGTNFYSGFINISLRPKGAILLKSGTSAGTSAGTQLLASVTLLLCALLTLFNG